MNSPTVPVHTGRAKAATSALIWVVPNQPLTNVDTKASLLRKRFRGGRLRYLEEDNHVDTLECFYLMEKSVPG
jgi:hypothetical protein